MLEHHEIGNLFETALSMPAITECKEPMDCPLRDERALTLERVQHIRDQVAANTAYRNAETSLGHELRAVDSKVQTLVDNATQALPKFMQVNGAARRKDLFPSNRSSRYLEIRQQLRTGWRTQKCSGERRLSCINWLLAHGR